MAPLTTTQRNKLPDSAFAIPETRSYPINTKRRARNALSRVSAFGTQSEKARVCHAVGMRYPSIHRMSCPGVSRMEHLK